MTEVITDGAELLAMLGEEDRAEVVRVINKWLARGDGVAVYTNNQLGHPMAGHQQFVSYGSPEALVESPEPPVQMPDVGGAINWRYQLSHTYKGEPLREGE
jgi:hypothetical protein